MGSLMNRFIAGLALTLVFVVRSGAQVDATSIISTVAGSEGAGFRGDGGRATEARFQFQQNLTVQAVAFDSADNLFVADTGNGRIRMVTRSGVITTVAGTGAEGFYGDGGPATQAVLNTPSSIAIDREGRLYIADARNNRVRRVDRTGIINTFAGGGSASPGFLPNDGERGVPATQLRLFNPRQLTFKGTGDLYVSEELRISPAGLAWRGCCPGAFDAAGNSFHVSDDRVYRNGVPYAGTSVWGFAGDGGPALAAQLRTPGPLAVDSSGNLYIADNGNLRIRRVTSDGRISTIAGVQQPSADLIEGLSTGDGGPAGAAKLGQIVGMAFDADGNLHIAERADYFNRSTAVTTISHKVRKIARWAPSSSSKPPIITATVNGASFDPGIVPGSWASILGSDLAPIASPGREWRAAEIIDGRLPTILEGVTVRVNGRRAAIAYIGPNQINFQAPDDETRGSVQVEVTTPAGSTTSNTQLRSVAPAMFAVRLGETWIPATVHVDGTPVGRPEMLPGSRPASPGEIISLFGTGFGLTTPVRRAGELIDRAPLANTYIVRIGSMNATAHYGGLVSPGLYQFNVEIPVLPEGNYLFSIDIAGARTQPNLQLAVAR